MRVVLQRVKKAKVTVSSKIIGEINKGLVIFLGVDKSDSQKDADYLAERIVNLRIFEDAQGKMNLSTQEVKGELLVVSQFTLLGNCKNGRRPSFDKAAQPNLAKELYNYFIKKLKEYSLSIETGEFRAVMQVELINDGPVTFILDSSDV
ncbi:MAG: D-aminoacyl-tRNA deacylase [Candidatus Omnitrophota bacterium]|nr:D-aminoacyl-tRNA deacylase [Candidatus Omnitrophota bacterium]